MRTKLLVLVLVLSTCSGCATRTKLHYVDAECSVTVLFPKDLNHADSIDLRIGDKKLSFKAKNVKSDASSVSRAQASGVSTAIESAGIAAAPLLMVP